MSETNVRIDKLVLPIFVTSKSKSPESITSMPGVFRYPVSEELMREVQSAYDLGIRSVILFGIPSYKDDIASSAYDEAGPVQQAIRLLKGVFGDKLVIMADECMDEYTSHGHCGIVKERGNSYYVDNDESLKIHAEIASSLAEAGADVIAPSSMMDGVVGSIRRKLDEIGLSDIMIMSYSVKYASALYGPFREAAGSAPSFGNRRTYQMDPRNSREALLEAKLDVEEGADILMVKPAHTYLDIIQMVKRAFPEYPLAAYHVSGEYSMIKAASSMGWIDEKSVIMEVSHSIFRAGADILITYFAKDIAKIVTEGFLF